MRPEDVREHLECQPFEPFRLFMSGGATFVVQHPDMCIVSRSSVYVGIADRKPSRIAQRVAHCALMHITRIEPLNGTATRTRKRRA